MSAQLKMLAIGTATQDVFLIGGSVFKPVMRAGKLYEDLPLGAKLSVQDIAFSTGGNASNAATTFARQGLHSMFMGVLGEDPAGDAVQRVLDLEGIDCRYVRQQADRHTSYSTILLAPNGERTILNYHGENLRADGSDLNLKTIAEADWLYLSSLGSMSLLEKVVSLAAKNGVKVALNPARTELDDAPRLRSLLDDITVLIANKEEMQLIVEGKKLEDLVRHACNLVPVAIVSDGPNGAMVSDGNEMVWAGMYEDVKVVDRLGAGDAFGSGFVAMYAQGKSLEDSLVFASANSTSVVTKVGAKEGILHKNARLHDMPLKITKATHAA